MSIQVATTIKSSEQSAKALAEAVVLEMRKKFPDADEIYLRFELIRALIW